MPGRSTEAEPAVLRLHLLTAVGRVDRHDLPATGPAIMECDQTATTDPLLAGSAMPEGRMDRS